MNQTVSPAARTAGAPLQSSESAALSLRNVSKSYGANAALKDASLRFYPGEIHAIIGENGAGKSTLISVVAGVTPRSTRARASPESASSASRSSFNIRHCCRTSRYWKTLNSWRPIFQAKRAAPAPRR